MAIFQIAKNKTIPFMTRGKINPVKWQKSHSVEIIFEETFVDF